MQISRGKHHSRSSVLGQPNRQSFERTYGWAWLLKLAQAFARLDRCGGKTLARNLDPLAEALAQTTTVFSAKATYPIRTGVHPNTAFGLSFALDYATAKGNKKLQG